jgi:enoyl-CoA hydratase
MPWKRRFPYGLQSSLPWSVERKDKVLVVSLNRPDALNAINAGLHTEISQIFSDIAHDQETETVVLTGKGRAFCAGGDIKWFQEMTPSQLDALFTEARKIIIDMLEVEQPIIAAVNGPATGLGATLALFSDVIYAADNAKIGDPHVRVGVVAGDGGAVIWPWLVGRCTRERILDDWRYHHSGGS